MAGAWAHDPSTVYALHAHTAAAQAAAAQAAAAQAAAAQAAAAQVAAAQAAAVVQQQAAILQLQKQLHAQPPMPPPPLSTQVPEQLHPQELPKPPEKTPERQPEWQHGQGSPTQNAPHLSMDPERPAPPALPPQRYAHQLHAPQHLPPPDATAPPGLPPGFMAVPYPMAAPTTFVPAPHGAYHAPASLHALHFAPGQPMPLTAPMPFSPPPFAAAPPPPVPAPLPSTPATFAPGCPPEATIVPTATVTLQAVNGSEPAGASASVRPANGSMGESTPPHESPASSPEREPDGT